MRCWIHCAEARGASIGNPQSYPKNLRAGLLDPLIGSAATVKSWPPALFISHNLLNADLFAIFSFGGVG